MVAPPTATRDARVLAGGDIYGVPSFRPCQKVRLAHPAPQRQGHALEQIVARLDGVGSAYLSLPVQVLPVRRYPESQSQSLPEELTWAFTGTSKATHEAPSF